MKVWFSQGAQAHSHDSNYAVRMHNAKQRKCLQAHAVHEHISYKTIRQCHLFTIALTSYIQDL